MTDPIRLMVVDESALVRRAIVQAVARDPGTPIAVTACDPAFALEKMRRDWPDVVILDLEMSRTEGLGLLRRILAERPTPVIICASLAEPQSAATQQAMSVGAVGLIAKPKLDLDGFRADAAQELVAAIRTAARAGVRAPPRSARRVPSERRAARDAPDAVSERPKNTADVILPASRGEAPPLTADKVIAIGTSTGGTQALEAVLTTLPATVPGIVIVQHMPERFTGMFAERLDSLCALEVREARNNDPVLPGRALVAPGGQHMLLRRNGGRYHVEIVDGPVVNRHKPSVDLLFRSVARFAGRNALGVIMTGMGDDGALGMQEMHAAGAMTIAQDEASCVVFGMPKEAIRLGGVDRVVPLGEIAAAIQAACLEGPLRAAR